ncbi:uncharacterized protein HMPREF1541_00870 [Cyphellophora europaea CBS 101466]|uniref:Transcription factor domain-containing protein n=1 Tax=Cyphellophora europaea (strain CBS 101466) TaxID=1220924 RepID=W2SF71_CYPE1|nr:uncharacterized protein HMPREF1541_00870 [Cyphellophora europaea CBS 101466]ETN46683.1 hypothetical protein HMPREF1541_00870 [Cyphellophora europaea CBS 101466]
MPSQAECYNSIGSNTGSPETSAAAASPAPLSMETPQGRGLSQLACNVIGSDPHCLFGPAEEHFFTRLLPQLSETIPFVAAASAAFGAAYSITVLQKDNAVARGEEQYLQALKLLQHELRSPHKRLLPFFISSVLLAAADVISGRMANAHVHLRSMFSIFFSGVDGEEHPKEVSRRLSVLSGVDCAGETENYFVYILILLDTQTALYAWTRPPSIPSRFRTDYFILDTINDLAQHQPVLVHACLHFLGNILAGRAARGILDPPEEQLREQSKLIAALRHWLLRRDQLLADNTIHSYLPPERIRYLTVLTAHCYGMLVSISTILAQNQMIYDAFMPEFSRIVQCAEQVLGPVDLSNPHPQTPNLEPFSPNPGLIQPLSITARKCRSPHIRRKAVWLLLLTGSEGPLTGPYDASLGKRICEIEEARAFSFDLSPEDYHSLQAGDVDEYARVRTCWRPSMRRLPTKPFAPHVRFARRLPPPPPPPPSSSALHQTWDEEGRLEVWTEKIVPIGNPRSQVPEPVLEWSDPLTWRLLPFEIA